jgi:hypothetical protein
MSTKVNEMNPVNTDSVESVAVEPTAQTVPLEVYEKLYAQAVALEKRYVKLFELYNSLLDAYLNK